MFFVTINADIKRTAIEGKYFLSLAAWHSVLLARRGFHFAFSIVYCWFSSLLREVFLRVLRFSPLLKNQHFQIPIRSGTHGHVSTSSYELLSAPWVNKLQKQITNYNVVVWLFEISEAILYLRE